MKNGLRKYKIERKLHEKIDSNPDLKYYLDNEYVTEIIDLLIDGIGEVIEENNEALMNDIFLELRSRRHKEIGQDAAEKDMIT